MGGAVQAIANILTGREVREESREERKRVTAEAAASQQKLKEQTEAESAEFATRRERESARARQRALGQVAERGRETLLTGPLGLAGEPATGLKTLLGL